jgi:hypothetical protein
MQWDPKLLCAMNMSEAWRIRNDGIGDEWLTGQVIAAKDATFATAWVQSLVVRNFNACAIACFKAGSPTPSNDFVHALAPLANVSATKGIFSWHEPRILDHESHELCWIAPDAEKLQAIFFDKTPKRWVCREAYTMTVGFLQDLTESNERLNIAARAYNVDDDIHWGRWRLSGKSSK